MDFHGPIEAQEAGVEVDPVAGDLIILMNGAPLIRVNLSAGSWRRLLEESVVALTARLAREKAWE